MAASPGRDAATSASVEAGNGRAADGQRDTLTVTDNRTGRVYELPRLGVNLLLGIEWALF